MVKKGSNGLLVSTRFHNQATTNYAVRCIDHEQAKTIIMDATTCDNATVDGEIPASYFELEGIPTNGYKEVAGDFLRK